MHQSHDLATTEYQHATQLVSSRRVKQQQQQIMRQSLMFGGAAFGMLLFAIFFIPMLIRLVGGAGGVLAEEEDLVPPQIPQIAAPVEATSSATLTLTGFTTATAEVVILQNGQEVAKTQADASGNFSTTLQLSDGDNTVSAYAVKGSLESEVSRQFVTVFDNQEPTLTLVSPVEGQAIQGKQNQLVQLEAQTEPFAKVYLNGRLLTANGEGVVVGTHRLEPGTNTLSFEVVDRAGNAFKQEVKVSFQE